MENSKNILLSNDPNLNVIIKCINESYDRDHLINGFKCDVVRDQPFKTLVKFNINKKNYYLKIWWDVSIIRVLKNLYRGNFRALREAAGLLMLNKNHINTPNLIAYGIVRHKRLFHNHSYIITEEIENCQTLNSYFKTQYDESAIKIISRNLFLIHKSNLIYGDFHDENILIRNDKNTKEIFFLDWMGVKHCTNLNRQLYDLSNFIFYAKRNDWLYRDHVIDLFMNLYFSFYTNGDLNSHDYRRVIDKHLYNKNKYNKIYRKLVRIG